MSKFSNNVVYRAIRKYKWENLKWEIIDEADSVEELNEKEKYWIDKENSYIRYKDSNGYNMNLGGSGSSKITFLNKEQLKELGQDYLNGMPKKQIKEKYSIEKDYILNSICSGRQWSEYTSIPKQDFSEISINSKLNPSLIDEILEYFIEYGRIEKVSEKFFINQKIILKLLKGETWEKYTKFKNDSFYRKYWHPSVYFSQEDLKLIGEYKKNNNSIQDIFNKYPNVPKSIIYGIWDGYILCKYTGIENKKKYTFKESSMKNYIEFAPLVKELHAQGKHWKEISEELQLNCCKATIYRLLKL